MSPVVSATLSTQQTVSRLFTEELQLFNFDFKMFSGPNEQLLVDYVYEHMLLIKVWILKIF